jgi:hypothetical protein
MKKIDQRQSRQIGGMKTQNKFRNERLAHLEWCQRILLGTSILNSLAIIIMVLS